MLFVIWVLLILIGLLFPKSKIVTGLMFLFMVVSICFRTQGADYLIYRNEYMWSVSQMFSDVHYAGYLYIEHIAHNIGIEFEQWLVVIGLISTAFMYLGIRRLTPNVNAVLALFLIYPFSHEAVQVRTYLANSLFIFALPLVLKEPVANTPNTHGKLKKLEKQIPRYILFYVLAVIACTFHFEAIFYVACITFMLFLPKKYGKAYVFGGAIILFGLIEIGILPAIISRFNTRIAYWLSGRTGLGIIIPIFITLIIWYGMQLAGKMCVKKSVDSSENFFYKRILRLSDFIILTIPLYCYDITFNRLWRLFLILFYVMIARLMRNKMSRNQRLWLISILIILFVSVLIYEGVFMILYGFFENNGIFGMSSVF